MELSQFQPHFSPHVLEKADKHWCNWNTGSMGKSSQSGRERARTHPQSRGAALSLKAGPHSLPCVALFPSLSHQNYIIDSEGRVMFYKVKHINGFLSTQMFRCAGISKWQRWVEKVLSNRWILFIVKPMAIHYFCQSIQYCDIKVAPWWSAECFKRSDQSALWYE